MVIKWGKMGRFLACTGYPECKNTKDFKDVDGKIVPVEEETTDETCEKCGRPMVIKRGRFGRFLACSGYPECKSSKPLSIGVACPTCKVGYLTERRSRRGKVFFGCNRYPDCTFAAWDRPLPEACPQCASPYLLQKYSKRDGARHRLSEQGVRLHAARWTTAARSRRAAQPEPDGGMPCAAPRRPGRAERPGARQRICAAVRHGLRRRKSSRARSTAACAVLDTPGGQRDDVPRVLP